MTPKAVLGTEPADGEDQMALAVEDWEPAVPNL